MLDQLTVQNFGLIEKLSLEFTNNLNILTGETGAGKSILIDALRSVLGERMDSSYIRNPKEQCLIEAVFNLSSKALRNNPVFQDFLNADDTNLIIQRTLSADGKSKIKVNGLSITVGQLKTIGNHLIDFHGAHDHQMLFAEDGHINILDQLIDFKNLKTAYTKEFKEYQDLNRKLNALSELSQTRQRDLDLLTHQVKELETVSLSEENFETITQEQVKINNAERLHEHIQTLLAIFEDEEQGINNNLRRAFTPLKNLNQIDEKTLPLFNQLTSVQEEIKNVLIQLSDYADSLYFDAAKAQEINRLYDAYIEIKRKYGPSLDDAKKFYLESKEKLDLIQNFEHSDQELRAAIVAKEKELNAIAQKMSKLRKETALDLNKTIEKELKDLGILHVHFDVHFDKTDFNTDGFDKIAFYISPNAGEDLKPLAQIVSSGEAARVMLALKKALIKVDPIPVLIFDEIDAQIGGRLGTITGKKLKDLSKNRQVILITHLPQIASFANRHFKVIKSVKSGRAITDVIQLEGKKQIEEIAQMMSGQDISKLSLSHAEDMLATAQRNS